MPINDALLLCHVSWVIGIESGPKKIGPSQRYDVEKLAQYRWDIQYIYSVGKVICLVLSLVLNNFGPVQIVFEQQNSVLKDYFWTCQKQFGTVQNNLDLPQNNLKVSKTIWFQNHFGLIERQGLTVLIYTLCLQISGRKFSMVLSCSDLISLMYSIKSCEIFFKSSIQKWADLGFIRSCCT